MDLSKIFLPISKIFGTYSFKKKFLIVTIAFVLPFVLPSFFTFKYLHKELSIVQSEQEAIEFMELLKTLLIQIQQHRGLMQGFLAGEREFWPKIEELRKQIVDHLEQLGSMSQRKSLHLQEDAKKIEALWKHIVNDRLGVEESFAFHTRLIKKLLQLQKKIALKLGLYNDDNIKNHYLIRTVFDTLPSIMEHLGEIRGLSTRVLASGSKEKERDAIQRLLILLHFQMGALRDALRYYGSMDESLDIGKLQKDIATFTKKVRQILDGTRIDAKSFFLYATKILEETKELYDRSLERLRKELVRRALSLKLQILLLALGLLFVSFVVAAIFFGFFYSIYTPLQKFQEAIQKIAKGDYGTRVDVKTQDELKTLADTFNTLISDLRKHMSYLGGYKIALNAATLVTRSDIDGTITYANEAFLKATGYKLEEILGKPHSIFRHPQEPKALFERMWKTIRSKKVWKGRLRIVDKYGKTLVMQTAIVPLLDENGEIEEFVAVRVDITELIEAQEKIKRMLYYDTLTSLPNRVKLIQDCRKKEANAIILINIEDFRVLNDIYGYEGGNFILQQIAERLKRFESEHIRAYRFPSDEFALVIFEPIAPKELEALVSRIVEDIEKRTFHYNGYDLKLLLRAGSATLDDRSKKIEEIILDAESAIKEAKSTVRKIVHFDIGHSSREHYIQQLRWIEKIQKAIEEERIEPYFQPIYNNKTRQVEKYEALIRLIDEDGAVITPFYFLDIAKKVKLYTQLTQIMVQKSLRYFQDRNEDLSINLSTQDIEDEKVYRFVLEKIEEFSSIKSQKKFPRLMGGSLQKGCVTIELTESEEVENYDLIAKFNQKVKDLGYKIAIDDFGTGYSNFVYILNMGFDYLKIDGSLVRTILTEERSLTLVKAIVDFSHELGLKTIAEFVENESIQKKLEEIGVDYSQGYYISKPLSIEELKDFKPHL